MFSNVRVLMLAMLLLSLVGCKTSVIKHPLVDPSAVTAHPELYGVYRAAPDSERGSTFVHVGAAGPDYPKGFLQLITIEHFANGRKPVRANSYVGFAMKVDERNYFLHIPLPKPPRLFVNMRFRPRKWEPDKVGGYLIVRLTARPNGFDVFYLDEEFIAAQVKAKHLDGHMQELTKDEKDFARKDLDINDLDEVPLLFDIFVVTTGSEELRRFFKQNMDRGLFGEDDGVTYTRIE